VIDPTAVIAAGIYTGAIAISYYAEAIVRFIKKALL
jgi:hypothetical protein